MRAAALLLLGLTAGARAEDAEKEKLGTVIGIDLGTTCVSVAMYPWLHAAWKS